MRSILEYTPNRMLIVSDHLGPPPPHVRGVGVSRETWRTIVGHDEGVRESLCGPGFLVSTVDRSCANLNPKP